MTVVVDVVQSLSYGRFFATQDIAACQVPLFYTISSHLPKIIFIESVMISNYLILCRPFSFSLQSCPESGSFPMSPVFVSGDQIIEASASVLRMNIQD